MVGGRSHGAHAVVASGKTTSNSGREKTVSISGIIDTLEEDEGDWVGGLSWCKRVSEILDGEMGVSNNLA